MLFFLISAVIVTIMLCAIGSALQHVDLSNASINLCLSAIPSVIMLLLDFLLINKDNGQQMIVAHLKEAIMVYVGFGLLIVPLFLHNLIRVCIDTTSGSTDKPAAYRAQNQD